MQTSNANHIIGIESECVEMTSRKYIVKATRVSFEEQQKRSNAFVLKHQADNSERGQSQLFWDAFFNIFGIDAHTSCEFEKKIKIPGKSGYWRIDCFLEGKMIIEHKSRGTDLVKALDTQAEKYYYHLKSPRPRYLVICNFQNFVLRDKEQDKEYKFPLKNLTRNLHRFAFLMSNDELEPSLEIPLSIKASTIMGDIYSRLVATNYSKEDREELLVRLVYCLFADDSGIFEKGIFHDFIAKNKNEHFGFKLNELFDNLNLHRDNRAENIPEHIKKFRWINGNLFKRRVSSVRFDKDMVRLLLEASQFNWENVSPAIFGSLFQSVMDKGERRATGSHYTSEENILKLINPLFMDELRAEFETIRDLRSGTRIKELEKFHEKLSRLKFFDPACGAGNFLIITYKKLRELEMDVIAEYNLKNKVLDIKRLIKINVDQFYGIELNKFSSEIAAIALWMMDHIMNNRVSAKYGLPYVRLPLTTHPNIVNADALEMDWNEVLPVGECDYVLGNPPFGGSKTISVGQRNQLKQIVKSTGVKGGTLDFVCGWFIKAGLYVNEYIPPHTHTHTHTHTHVSQLDLYLQTA